MAAYSLPPSGSSAAHQPWRPSMPPFSSAAAPGYAQYGHVQGQPLPWYTPMGFQTTSDTPASIGAVDHSSKLLSNPGRITHASSWAPHAPQMVQMAPQTFPAQPFQPVQYGSQPMGSVMAPWGMGGQLTGPAMLNPPFAFSPPVGFSSHAMQSSAPMTTETKNARPRGFRSVGRGVKPRLPLTAASSSSSSGLPPTPVQYVATARIMSGTRVISSCASTSLGVLAARPMNTMRHMRAVELRVLVRLKPGGWLARRRAKQGRKKRKSSNSSLSKTSASAARPPPLHCPPPPPPPFPPLRKVGDATGLGRIAPVVANVSNSAPTPTPANSSEQALSHVKVKLSPADVPHVAPPVPTSPPPPNRNCNKTQFTAQSVKRRKPTPPLEDDDDDMKALVTVKEECAALAVNAKLPKPPPMQVAKLRELDQFFKSNGVSPVRPKKRPVNAPKGIYSCPYCGQKIAHKYNLVRHVSIHTGEKLFSCDYCNKAFHRKADLRKHERIHSGMQPHCCPLCKRRFGDRSNMLRHWRGVHRRDGDPRDFGYVDTVSELEIRQQIAALSSNGATVTPSVSKAADRALRIVRAAVKRKITATCSVEQQEPA